MKCPSCGAKIEKGSTFCVTCGANVKELLETNHRNRAGAVTKVIAAILCILIVALAVLLLFLLHRNSDKTAEVTSTTAKTTQSTTAERVSIVPETTVLTEDNSSSLLPPLVIAGITASSNLVENNKTFLPNYMIDGNTTTAWAEGASGIGLGEWVKVEFDGTPTVSGMIISTGYQKNSDLFKKNGRPYIFTVNFSNGSSETITIEDTMDSQKVMFYSPVETRFVSLDLVGIAPGSDYDDACISEISFI